MEHSEYPADLNSSELESRSLIWNPEQFLRGRSSSPPLSVHEDSRKIKESPTTRWPHRDQAPRPESVVIHTTSSDFMNVVHQLTGTHSSVLELNNPASNDYDAESPASTNGSPRSEDFVDGGGSGESHRHDNVFNPYKRKMLLTEKKMRISSEEGLGLQDDGYSWRKYGQKDILGAKFPRDYYRCTHRSTQNCRATKQVQRPDDDPTVFEVTYRGTHSCSQAMASNDYDAESLASADGSLRSEDLVDGGGSGESHRHDYIFNSKKRKTLPKWTEKVRISSERGLEGLRDDGYSWRKYGKKDILGAKFAR
ncbi:unnamed protein product [Thlaspi arvense]|uniref:WRKY domain-containing protein n=1 Tax=Thlaspi arvense TaxID=13288 RepID=A0AAU9SNI9_THLAR|nr:unnamed protein product [Thlaspi arvense]